MNTIDVTQVFNCTPERLFAALTQQTQIIHWWGGADVLLSEFLLQLDQLGDWSATVVNYKSGKFFTMSGIVTLVKPNEAVALTWAWHDANGQRQHESQVYFFIAPESELEAGGTRLTIRHEGLLNPTVARSHEQGWQASLTKLSTYLDTQR